jgi:hypothetical protein
MGALVDTCWSVTGTYVPIPIDPQTLLRLENICTTRRPRRRKGFESYTFAFCHDEAFDDRYYVRARPVS